MNEQENQKMNAVFKMLSGAYLTTTYVSTFTGTEKVGGEPVEMRPKGNQYKEGNIEWHGELFDENGWHIGNFTFSLPATNLLGEDTIQQVIERTAWEEEERKKERKGKRYDDTWTTI